MNVCLCVNERLSVCDERLSVCDERLSVCVNVCLCVMNVCLCVMNVCLCVDRLAHGPLIMSLTRGMDCYSMLIQHSTIVFLLFTIRKCLNFIFLKGTEKKYMDFSRSS